MQESLMRCIKSLMLLLTWGWKQIIKQILTKQQWKKKREQKSDNNINIIIFHKASGLEPLNQISGISRISDAGKCPICLCLCFVAETLVYSNLHFVTFLKQFCHLFLPWSSQKGIFRFFVFSEKPQKITGGYFKMVMILDLNQRPDLNDNEWRERRSSRSWDNYWMYWKYLEKGVKMA